MRIRRARLRDVRAPDEKIGRVVPAGRLRHVGLLSPDLRGGGWQVAVPVVEGGNHAADEGEVSGPGSEADLRHRRDRREAGDPIGTEALDGIDVGGGDELGDFLPGGTHETAATAQGLVAAGVLRIPDDRGPGADGLLLAPRLAPELDETGAHQGVLESRRAVDVPGVAGAARAAARLVIRDLRPRARIVGLLCFPGDEAALHVDLPTAGSRAVDTMCRADDLVVVPAVAVTLLPAAALAGDHAPAVGELLDILSKKHQPIEKMTHLAPAQGWCSVMVALSLQGLQAAARADCRGAP